MIAPTRPKAKVVNAAQPVKRPPRPERTIIAAPEGEKGQGTEEEDNKTRSGVTPPFAALRDGRWGRFFPFGSTCLRASPQSLPICYNPAMSPFLSIRRSLLHWYDRNGRQMPWRVRRPGRADPYHVLVSEAMLQQTQVATVIDYFNRFIAAFPTVEHLAAASEQEVLRLWQGLGYYRRAKHLHRAAQRIVTEHGGQVPRDVNALLDLPGVGRYTAGAIASIAYDVRAPILDGNVARVLARCFGIEEPVDAPATRKQFWQLAEELTAPSRPGDFNQAMMDLGAMVCTPRRPSCVTCPLARYCRAKATDRVDELPRTLPRRAPRTVTHHILAIERGGRYLVQQRPASGLWANLWQLPTAEEVPTDGLTAWAAEQLGLQLGELQPLDRFTHQTTHRTIRFELWRTSVAGGRLKRGAGEWRALDDMYDLPLGNPQVRAIEQLQAKRSHPKRSPSPAPT